MHDEGLDELQRAWARHSALLERSVAIDERLLRETMLRKVRFALAPFVLWRAIEVVIGIAVLAAAVRVIGAHLAEPRYLVVGGALAVFTFVITAFCAQLLVRVLQLDRAGPVVQIQREVERIQRLEYQSLKWALLGGVLCWLPALLVPFEALTGVDALARVDPSYLLWNLGIGGGVILLGQALSKRFVERPDVGPRAGRILDALSGRGLRAAKEHLRELATFVDDGERPGLGT